MGKPYSNASFLVIFLIVVASSVLYSEACVRDIDCAFECRRGGLCQPNGKCFCLNGNFAESDQFPTGQQNSAEAKSNKKFSRRLIVAL
ncbi:hypothetical protein Tsubulata_031535 [Turnera subulata]|uniref:Uncharacterized protein n=1 Tax=Turnera subulata TaxID=218843 RepID=A0A9Q0FCX5_9ROSI|nr:hypothetical protein Tsubulata_031535 [Turnera subulata]